MLFDKALVLRAKISLTLVDFWRVEIRAIIRKSSLSLFYLFVIPPYLIFLLAVFSLLILFLFLFCSFSLFHLLIENSFHLSALFLKFWLFAVIKLFWEGTSNVALLLEFLGFFGIIHVRCFWLKVMPEKKKEGEKERIVE